MRKRKIILIIVLFMCGLTGSRFLWSFINPEPINPNLVNGVADLRNEEFNKDNLFSLKGQWEFYPGMLFTSLNDEPSPSNVHKKYLQVPGKWNDMFSDSSNSAFGYGTYRLRVLVDNYDKQTYSILISGVQSSSELYVNGELLGSSGVPAENKEHYTARVVPYSASITTDKSQSEIEIVIHTANYAFKNTGGISKSILLGSPEAIAKQRLTSIGLQLLLCVVLLLHAIYAAILFSIGPRQKMLLYFSLLIIAAIITVIIDDDKLLQHFLNLNYQWTFRLLLVSNISSFIFILLTIKHLLFENEQIKIVNYLVNVSIVNILLILLGPVINYLNVYTSIFALNLFILSLGVILLILRSIHENYDGSIFLLLSITAITNSTLWGLLKNYSFVTETYYPFDLIISCIGFATFGFKRYFWNTKQTENLAQDLQRTITQKDTFLANTSHELRNPLHSIINIAEAVLDSEKDVIKDRNTDNLKLLISVGRQMTLLLNDLLDLSQLRESNIQLKLSSVQIQSVASGVMDMLNILTEGKSIKLIVDIPESFPSILADEKRLIQILFNLLHNAVKYTNEGSVRVHTDIQRGRARIHITDTGIGMDKETQIRAFQPYEQGDSSMTAMDGGIGLGLSICKQLVELHGGTLSVTSTLGKGSTFTFTMALTDPSLAKGEIDERARIATGLGEVATTLTPISPVTVTTSPESATNRRPKILAVDDDPVNLKILISVLSNEGYDIATFTSGTDALLELDTNQWDLIITDVMMPHMSGYELTRIIRERFTMAELPILLLTTRSQPEDIYTGFISGANEYVAKPMNPLELKGRVRSLTDLKRSVNEQLRLEAAYLQAQIQPHFLFNTLNSISALASFDTIRMSHLIDAFSAYLRLSFNFLNAEPMIAIERELELVRAYLYIEKERFDDRLTVIWDLPSNLNFHLPPLSIQPLVENAVRHGILSRSKGGTVRISISKYTDHIEISISDNGKGMDAEQLQQLLSGQPNTTRGIGVLNTHRRIMRLYGKGLQIQSNIDQGTVVSFRVPTDNIELHQNSY